MRKFLLVIAFLSSLAASAQPGRYSNGYYYDAHYYRIWVDSNFTPPVFATLSVMRAKAIPYVNIGSQAYCMEDSSNYRFTGYQWIKNEPDLMKIKRLIVGDIASLERDSSGTIVFGQTDATGSYIAATKAGNIAGGKVTRTGSIEATGDQSYAHGNAADSSKIIASGPGSLASGYIYWGFGSNITASGSGSTARGVAYAYQNPYGLGAYPGLIQSTSSGSLAGGIAASSEIIASNWGAIAYGAALQSVAPVVNKAKILAPGYGAMAHGGVRDGSILRAQGAGSLVHGYARDSSLMEATLNGGVTMGTTEFSGIMTNKGVGAIIGIANKGIMEIPSANYTAGRGVVHGGFVLGHCWWYGSYMSAAGDGSLVGGDQNTNWNRDVNLISYTNVDGSSVGDTNYNGGSSSMQWGVNLHNTGDYSFLFGHTIRNSQFKQFKVGWANDMIHANGLTFNVRLGDRLTLARAIDTVVAQDSISAFAGGRSVDGTGSIKATSTDAWARGFVNRLGRVLASGVNSSAVGYSFDSSLVQATGFQTYARGAAQNGSTLQATQSNATAIGQVTTQSGYRDFKGVVTASGTASWAWGYSSSSSITSSNFASWAGGLAQRGPAGPGDIIANNQASWAWGYSKNGSNITSSQAGSWAGGFADGRSSVVANGAGGWAFGRAQNKGAIAGTSGSIAMGMSTDSSGTEGSEISTGDFGSISMGRAYQGGKLLASNSGGRAHGYAAQLGRIWSLGVGAVASGQAAGASALIMAAGPASRASGYALTEDSVYIDGLASFGHGRTLWNRGNYSVLLGASLRNSQDSVFLVGWKDHWLKFYGRTGVATYGINGRSSYTDRSIPDWGNVKDTIQQALAGVGVGATATGTLVTTDGEVHDIDIDIPNNERGMYDIAIIASDLPNNEVKYWNLLATYKDVDGSASLVGSYSTIHAGQDAVGSLTTATTDLLASGGNMRIRVTGNVAITATWTYKVIRKL